MLKLRIAALVGDTKTVLRVLRHPKVPAAARMAAGLVAGYVFSPIQLIPTFIPVIGQIDDLFAIAIGTILRRLVEPQLLIEYSRGA